MRGKQKKMTAAQVDQIRTWYQRSKVTYAELAKIYKCSIATIGRIVARQEAYNK